MCWGDCRFGVVVIIAVAVMKSPNQCREQALCDSVEPRDVVLVARQS